MLAYFILNWLNNKLLVDVWPFLVEMMAVAADGSLLWQTPAYDGADANCVQRSLSWHCLLAVSIMWFPSVTHAFDAQFGGQGYDNACFWLVSECDGALRGKARATCLARITLHLRLPESDWVTLTGLAMCSCFCMRWTRRSHEANGADFAPASSGANGTAKEDTCTV
eukprot:s1446_g5.t1